MILPSDGLSNILSSQTFNPTNMKHGWHYVKACRLMVSVCIFVSFVVMLLCWISTSQWVRETVDCAWDLSFNVGKRLSLHHGWTAGCWTCERDKNREVLKIRLRECIVEWGHRTRGEAKHSLIDPETGQKTIYDDCSRFPESASHTHFRTIVNSTILSITKVDSRGMRCKSDFKVGWK